MTKEEISSRVHRYVMIKQEGVSWDFKRQWYDKEKGKSDLLHDIICMANLPTDDDGLIIIGVDEEHDYSLNDVTSDKNRKNSHELVKFLRDKHFDGGVRPTVYVESVIVADKTLDVIVVENSNNTPYYLSERFQQVEAYHIYTRVGDSNTPIDKSADRNIVEALWKKRFGIDKPTLERFKIYLHDYTNWESADGEQSWYYKFAPEFRIETEREEGADAYNYYCFTQINSRPSYFIVLLKYHSTIMVDTRAVSLDSGNFFTAVPEAHMFGYMPYYYYDTDSIQYSLHCFFQYRAYGDFRSNYMFENWNACVPILGSKEEADAFFKWVKGRKAPNKTQSKSFIIPDSLPNGEDGKQYQDEYSHALMITTLYEQYLNEELEKC